MLDKDKILYLRPKPWPTYGNHPASKNRAMDGLEARVYMEIKRKRRGRFNQYG